MASLFVLLPASPAWVQQIRTTDEQARYRPILNDLVEGLEHLAIFLVEATGRLSGLVMELLKLIVQDSPNRTILNYF